MFSLGDEKVVSGFGLIRQTLLEIDSELISSGFERDAQELNNLVTEFLQEDNERKKSQLKKEIIERTHVKWLGDLNVQTLDYKDWWKLLEKLKKSVQKIS